MTVLYWQDFDCTAETRHMQHASTVHMHHDSHEAAGRAFLSIAPWSVRFDRGDRYYCVRGPGGLVRAVR